MGKWIKAILASLLSLLTCFFCGRFFGFTGFTFAWVTNFVLMAWFTYIDSLFKWKYRSTYFDSHKFEKNGSIYKIFGVQLYRKLLVYTGWEKISRKDLKITSRKSSLLLAEQKSRSSEAGHMIIFLLILGVTFIVADSFKAALWLLILNVLLNIYPVFVHRYNRPRYRSLLQKMELKEQKT